MRTERASGSVEENGQNAEKIAPSAGQTQEQIEKRVLGLLGLCARARRLVIGASQVCEALRGTAPGKTPILVVEADDTSAPTHKRLCDKTTYYHVPRVRLSVHATVLGAAVGKKEAAVAAVGVTEPHLAAEIRRLIETNSTPQER